jgi:hypothetical protein
VTKEAGFPTVWREGRKEPDGTHSGSKGWSWSGVSSRPSSLSLFKDDNLVDGANG